jgi:amidohydrolase
MKEPWQNDLDRRIDELYPRIVEVRRWLHSHPEVSNAERETSLYLYQLLGDEGLEVRMGPEGRGVVADDRNPGEPAEGLLALRADIDALRIHDAKQVDYRSQCEGIMHACGHDAHSALVFATLVTLRRMRSEGRLPWNIRMRGVFQPSEETCEGARQMVDVGAIDGTEAILATHVDPSLPLGKIGLRAGVLTANCDEMRITISGSGGHAARPHESSDPIAAAAQLINALYLYIPRVTDSQDAVVVTIGQIDGGDNANVIPESVFLRGTIRTLDKSVRHHAMEHICRLAYGIGETTETKIQVQFGLGSHSIDNDKHIIELFAQAGREVLGAQGLHRIPRPSMGSEDFAVYLDHVPGAMIRLGCASDKTGAAPLHTPLFDVDEEALRIGAKIVARTAVMWFAPGGRPSTSTSTEFIDPSPFRGDDAVAP